MITQQTLLVDVTGAAVGQVNGLAIYRMGDFSFGKPSRIEKEHYPSSSINGLVEKQLQEYAERLKHSSAATPSNATEEERET
jgi:predicted ATP-dependent protease